MFGKRLRGAREALGLTQSELAERAQVHTAQIARWEKDQAIPGGDNLIRLSKELGCSMDYLAGLVRDPKKHIEDADLTPAERRLLDAYRRGEIKRLLHILVTDEDFAPEVK